MYKTIRCINKIAKQFLILRIWRCHFQQLHFKSYETILHFFKFQKNEDHLNYKGILQIKALAFKYK